MPHPIVEIDELMRLVIDELVETSPQTVVSFALTCRSLEEPTLSSLWREKRSLYDLVKVLPNYIWVQDKHRYEDIRRIVSCCDFPGDRIRFNFTPSDRARPLSGGLDQVATIRFLDARIVHQFLGPYY